MKCSIFNIPAIITCPNATDNCKKYCYAKKAERVYPQVLPSRQRNLRSTFKSSFVSNMVNLLEHRRSKLVRIHESGDFYNQHYFDKWVDIASQLKDKTFLAYTQNYSLDISNLPDNFTLYWSVWDDSVGIPDQGSFAYVIDNNHGIINNKYAQNYHLCEKGKGSDLKCHQCMYCFEGKGNVAFKLH